MLRDEQDGGSLPFGKRKWCGTDSRLGAAYSFVIDSSKFSTRLAIIE